MHRNTEPQSPATSRTKVLMFGWEFPPHISGGLGTACLGITQSLLLENTDVLFVVPKSYGDEPIAKSSIVNASTIPLPLTGNEKKTKIKTSVVKTFTQKIQLPDNIEAEETSTMTLVEVPAVLDPYGVVTNTENTHSVSQWSYQITPGDTYDVRSSYLSEEESEIAVPNTYQFSGTYGATLNEEVSRYADVAGVIARQHDFDIIHAHDWMTFPAGITAREQSGKPLVIHVHATEIDRAGIGFGKIYDIEKRGMELADRIVAVSQWTKQIIVQHYGIPADKIHVVHNGISPSTKTDSSSNQSMGSHVVTFLGRVTHQKGPRYFVEAARKVVERFPDAHFIVAGSGDLLPQTIERVAQLKLSRQFHFTGFLTTEWIDRIWSISNVYVMPSVSEPFGITPLEAIQAGVPVIVSNQSGVSEVLPHALKVNFWDTDALAEAICSVLQYRSLSSMMKQKGEKELQQLSWQSAARKLNTIYHELTS